MKSQQLRLIETLAMGPLMIWGGKTIAQTPRHRSWGHLLAFFGIATTVLGARDLWRHSRGGALPGGKGDHLKPSDVDPAQLAEGSRVEMEHTTDPHIAREIALDHLAEDPLYYTHLRAIETHD